MASKTAILKNELRKQLVAKYAEQRAEYKRIISSRKSSRQERAEAAQKLASLPRNSNPIRVRNRCNLTGRPRSYYRFFGLSRIALRELALKGELPGVRKGSL